MTLYGQKKWKSLSAISWYLALYPYKITYGECKFMAFAHFNIEWKNIINDII